MIFHINKQKIQYHLLMGVSISKSNAYVQMRKKSNNRQASKQKVLLQKIKKMIESKLPQQQKETIIQKSQQFLRFQGRHPIQIAGLNSQKSIQMRMNAIDKQNFKKEDQAVAQTTNNRKILNSLKKSLHFAQKSPFQDACNQSQTEQFTKEQTYFRKKSTSPSYFSIQTKHDIESSLFILQPKKTVSERNINSRHQVKFRSNPVSSRKIQEETHFMNDWKPPQQTFESNGEQIRIPQMLSINLSNKFCQMGSHIQERQQNEIESGKNRIRSKMLAASKRQREK